MRFVHVALVLAYLQPTFAASVPSFNSLLPTAHINNDCTFSASLTKKEHRQRLHLSLTEKERGDDVTTQIVGGDPAPVDRYPYFAALGGLSNLFCGGSLICPEWILTAAHCLPRIGEPIGIGLLDTSKDNNSGQNLDLRFVQQVVVHPTYNNALFPSRPGEPSHGIDVALIRLNTPSSINPVALDDGTTQGALPDGADLEVFGFGTTSSGGSTSDILLETTVDFVPNKQCAMDYMSEIIIDQNMICAARAGKDACQGDSGGPLVSAEGATDPKQDIQVGIVSFGIGCADPNFPGVYTRVGAPEVISWINHVTNSCNSRGGSSKSKGGSKSSKSKRGSKGGSKGSKSTKNMRS